MAVDIQKGLELQSAGHLDDAEKIYLEFLKENPKQPDVSNLLGLVYLQKRFLDKSIEYFNYAVEGFSCAEYHQNLGLAYYQNKEYPKAMQCFDAAIGYEDKNLDFIRNLAQMAKKAEQTDFAIKFYKICLDLDKKDVIGWNNIGLLYEQKGDIVNAKNAYVNSLKIKENYEALHNLGVFYRMQRNFDESINCLKKALRYKPHSEITLLSLGMSYLSKKDFNNGYKYYMTKKPEVKSLYKNHWGVEETKGKTLCVYYDSGFGDQIMFSRYLKIVAEKFDKVRFYCSSELRTLFAKNFPQVEIMYNRDDDYDYSDNIMYLPYHLKMDFDNIPFAEGYLDAEKSRDDAFCTDKKKIGLFWQGNYDGYANRAIKLKELAPLLDLQDCQFYGFVKSDKENQITEFSQIIDIGKNLGDFYDTAAKLKNLDLFITIDTAAANLAGALGVKTYLMLPKASEWRWFDESQHTDWYKSVTIFKQTENNKWIDVVQRILEDLKKTY